MNIRCPHCQAVFRIDPERVPAAGARARCARCSGVFFLTRQGVAAGPGQAESPAQASHPNTAAAVESAPEPSPVSAPAWGNPPTASRESPAAAARPEGDAAPPSPGAASAPGASPPSPAPAAPATERPRAASFANQDPKVRAARLARALVSDIVAYHPERLEKSAAAGTLRSEFREEIVKSWEEYVAQVGLEMAKGTPFFRNALNELLAGGRKVF